MKGVEKRHLELIKRHLELVFSGVVFNASVRGC